MDLKFNVAQLLKEPVGATRRYELEEDVQELLAELPLVAPVSGRVQLLHIPGGVLAAGTLQTTVATECKRCLKPLALATDFEMEEEFKSTVDVLTGTPLPTAAEEDAALLINAHHILDLGEIIRQDLLLTAAPAVLCQPDCRGLCPTCGKDLNEGPCECQTEIEDPRWADLSHLLKKTSKK